MKANTLNFITLSIEGLMHHFAENISQHAIFTSKKRIEPIIAEKLDAEPIISKSQIKQLAKYGINVKQDSNHHILFEFNDDAKPINMQHIANIINFDIKYRYQITPQAIKITGDLIGLIGSIISLFIAAKKEEK